MSDPHLKRLAVLIVLVLAILVGSLYLAARPSRPAPAAPPAPVAKPNPPQTASTSSTQPKITWSQNQIEVILARTESASSDLTFSSSLNLQNAVVEAVPAIAGLLSIQQNSFVNVSAGTPNAVHISFLIPSSTALGTYEGTIHVRTGTSTIPQTLKVVVNVWQIFRQTSPAFTFKYPPGWFVTTEPHRTVLSDRTDLSSINEDTVATIPFFAVSKLGPSPGSSASAAANPELLSIKDWFSQYFKDGFSATPSSTTIVQITGRTGIRLELPEVGGEHAHIYVPNGSDVIEISFGLFVPNFASTYEKILSTISF